MIRFWEILPGAFVWLTLILPISLSFIFPKLIAVFFLFYTTIWLIRCFGFSYYLLKGYLHSKRMMQIDWRKIVETFNHPDFETQLKQIPDKSQKIIRELWGLEKTVPENLKKRADSIYHIVMVPTYKEEVEILRTTFQAIADAHYDLQKIIIVLATEERDHERAHRNGEILSEEFKGIFKALWVIEHPKNLPNENPGKGSNMSYASVIIKDRVVALGIDPSDVVVTSIDADNMVHKDYLPCLTLHYIANAERKKRSFQSLPLFFNNIWNVPILVRVVAMGSSFWHIIQSGRADRLRNFAAHSQPFDALIEMDFWSKTSIVEDGHQFWRSYFHFKGEHYVIPLFMPIYQDCVQMESYIKTLKAQYLQLRRWAWGVTDVAFVAKEGWEHRKELPLIRTLRRFYILFEGHYMWATAPLVISMASHFPGMINIAFDNSVMFYGLSLVFNIYFKLALSGILLSIFLSVILLPPHPRGFKWRLSAIFMWILLPIVTIFYGAIPAIDAQTRLMLGNRLEFNETKKVRT